MGNKNLKRSSTQPTSATCESWFYEEKSGIEIYVAKEGGSEIIAISWAKLRAALARKDK